MQSDEATLKVLGNEANRNDSSIKKTVCPRCGTENEFSNYFSRCSLPFNDNASAELIEKQEKFERIMLEAEKDPRFGKILEILENIMSRPFQ